MIDYEFMEKYGIDAVAYGCTEGVHNYIFGFRGRGEEVLEIDAPAPYTREQLEHTIQGFLACKSH